MIGSEISTVKKMMQPTIDMEKNILCNIIIYGGFFSYNDVTSTIIIKGELIKQGLVCLAQQSWLGVLN